MNTVAMDLIDSCYELKGYVSAIASELLYCVSQKTRAPQNVMPSSVLKEKLQKRSCVLV